MVVHACCACMLCMLGQMRSHALTCADVQDAAMRSPAHPHGARPLHAHLATVSMEECVKQTDRVCVCVLGVLGVIGCILQFLVLIYVLAQVSSAIGWLECV